VRKSAEEVEKKRDEWTFVTGDWRLRPVSGDWWPRQAPGKLEIGPEAGYWNCWQKRYSPSPLFFVSVDSKGG
jgi:hypothetical protein